MCVDDYLLCRCASGWAYDGLLWQSLACTHARCTGITYTQVVTMGVEDRTEIRWFLANRDVYRLATAAVVDEKPCTGSLALLLPDLRHRLSFCGTARGCVSEEGVTPKFCETSGLMD